jgi:2-methylaconitate cis-trans-isomerase PrpF
MGDGKVRVLFTLNGDANLDHTIDFADLAIVAANYQQASGATYTAGDFTYDGVVGFADLVALAKNYDAAINGGLLPAGASEQFASDWHLAQSIAPEPTTLMLLGLPLAIAARRRG